MYEKERSMRQLVFVLLLITVPCSVFSAADDKVTIGTSASLVALRNVGVTPVDRSQTTQLVDGGEIDTDGFAGVVINLTGQPEGTISRAGVVGAVLVPAVAPYDFALRTLGVLPAIIEVQFPVQEGNTFFMSKQVKFDVGFPRYRVLFYNSSDAAIRISFFAYRTRT